MKQGNTVDMAPYLRRVQRPGRYIGQEWNLPDKDFRAAKVSMVMAFPDLYEVGMSHLGLRILYDVVNATSDYSMERVMAVAPDLEALLRRDGTPLSSLETSRPLGDFDLIGFSVQYELCATNILAMLDLAAIPLRSEERDHRHPLVLGGGPCMYNPEPFAPFFDVILIGEGEEALLELMSLMEELEPQRSDAQRKRFLEAVSQVQGFYVPSLYEERDGAVKPRGEAPPLVHKRFVADLDQVTFPRKPLVPHTEIVHDRATLELFRGCLRGCRFCQAGMVYRPRRDKSLDTLLEDAAAVLKHSGYDELGLLSLSTMDYGQIGPLVDELTARYSHKGISLGLPSLRMDSFSVELAKKVQEVRKGTLTLAPEAGSQRMRNVINKNIEEADIVHTAVSAAKDGFRQLKFYMMVGLPLETFEDIEAIPALMHAVKEEARRETGDNRLKLSVSVGAFVPKSQTPFQWWGQDSEDSIREKQRYLKDWGKGQKTIRVNYHDFETSFLEAIIARGDRRIADLLESAYRRGARLDGWSEYFQYPLWCEAMEETGIDGRAYATRNFAPDETLPWDHISCYVTKEFLWREWEKARDEALTGHCYDGACHQCGLDCRGGGAK